MAHNYKKYVHLEGILEEDAISVSTPDGDAVRLLLGVIESTRDHLGNVVKTTESFVIEVGTKYAKYTATLKKGMPVSIEAGLRSRGTTLLSSGAVANITTIKAHRVLGIDYSSWKKGAE